MMLSTVKLTLNQSFPAQYNRKVCLDKICVCDPNRIQELKWDQQPVKLSIIPKQLLVFKHRTLFHIRDKLTRLFVI